MHPTSVQLDENKVVHAHDIKAYRGVNVLIFILYTRWL